MIWDDFEVTPNASLSKSMEYDLSQQYHKGFRMSWRIGKCEKSV